MEISGSIQGGSGEHHLSPTTMLQFVRPVNKIIKTTFDSQRICCCQREWLLIETISAFTQFSVDFTTNIAELNFRYTQ